MLAYVIKFTYLSAAKNSNKEYLTYGKGKHKMFFIYFGNLFLCTCQCFCYVCNVLTYSLLNCLIIYKDLLKMYFVKLA